MKPLKLTSVVSETLLVSGIILVVYGIGTGLTHPVEACGLRCFYYVGEIMPHFLIGIALLIASSVGFLFSLMLLQRTPARQDEIHK